MSEEIIPPTSVGHMPNGKWEFDKAVTGVFDDMIARSIPQYESMRAVVEAFGKRFGASTGTVLDLGCSTGISIKQFARSAKRVVGIEISEPMLNEARQRFQNYANVEIRALDLRREFPDVTDVDVTLSIFTLQFVPVEYRRRVLRDVYRSLKPGGAFIIAEKVVGESAESQEAFVEIYHAFKHAQGYSREEVERKALALEGALVANTARENVAMLEAAGFHSIEQVWGWVNFRAWVAVK